MGVDRNDYLMIGIDLGYENVDYEKFVKEIEDAPDRRFDIIPDCMGGKFAIAGKILAYADEYAGFGMIYPDPNSVNREELAAKISEATGRSIIADDLKLILFTQYS